MLRDLSEKILSLSLESLVHSSQTMAFKRYCCDLGITNRYSTSAYPKGNGQVETVNKVIVSELKNRLDDARGK